MNSYQIVKQRAVAIGLVVLSAVLSPRSHSISAVNTKNWQLAPEASFRTELQRLGLVSRSDESAIRAESPEEQTEIAEIEDLTEALAALPQLKSDGRKTNSSSSSVMTSYKSIRQRLVALKRASSNDLTAEEDAGAKDKSAALLREIVRQIDQIEMVPEEFVLYLKGSAQWNAGSPAEARKYWKQLLGLPATQRRYRSTWAAFRLGKSYLRSNPALAKENFELLRQQVTLGFKDSLDLARSSYGWEAQMAYESNVYAEAIRLYLKQRGEPSAVESLRLTANKALANASPADLQELAARRDSREVITSWLISEPCRGYEPDTNRTERVSRWLQAVKAASVKDDSLAERLALAAYQANLRDQCVEWIGSARKSVVARWLRAKLMLKDRDFDGAAAILQKIVATLPIPDESKSIPSTLEENLGIYLDGYSSTSAARQATADLGLAELARNHFVASLSAFMKAGFWPDAAYLSERILTIDELRAYIDKDCPAPRKFESGASESDPASRIWALRNLLARRLMRANRLDDARPYFDPESVAVYDDFIKDMRIGFGSDGSPEVQALARLHAAKSMFSEGRKLLATEGEPDWNMHPSSDYGLTEELRAKAEEEQLPPTEEELKRLRASALKRSFRYHYRYVAAELAWHAALVMPNNSDETAAVLWQGGTWIKYLNPNRADRFYKALVRRCRKTEIGQAADKMRWFPSLEEASVVEVPEPEM